MKIILCITLSFLALGQAQAGLFEYTLGESTHINAHSSESADAVETLQYNNSQNRAYSNYNNSYSSNSYYDNSSYNNSYSNDYYFSSDDSVSSISSEMDYLLDIASQIRRDISEIRSYSSRPYVVLKNQLENDLREIQDRINYLSDRKRELLQRNNYYENSYYSSNNGPFRSARLQTYYDKYNYSYDDYQYGYYSYDSYSNSYTRTPHWVNPSLSGQSQGYIYIR